MFEGAYNSRFSGTFNSIGRDLNNIGRDLNVTFEDAEKGILTLYHHTSKSAPFNAEERFPPPSCHPGTREAVLADLRDWVKRAKRDDETEVHSNRSSESVNELPFCWLYGPAGAGKSAIAQTLAELCAEHETLAGSFFFWRTDPSRNNHRQLFTTIALQLATKIPELRSLINFAVMKDPSVLTSTLEAQFDMLILQPWLRAQLHKELQAKVSSNGSFASVHSSQSNSSRVLIIDGLDECADSMAQARIISILGNALQRYTLPLRVLIASRPEPHIKQAFKGQFSSHWMPLDDTYQASGDIRKFLRDRFREILQKHSPLMEHVPRPWPHSEHIERLVQKASGYFIYPSTVLRYIDNDDAVPADSLDTVLGLSPAVERSESPFAELDALYRQILSTRKDNKLLLQILLVLVTFRDKSDDGVGHFFFQKFFHIPLGSLRATLSKVHSLFQEPSPVESQFQFCHASFTDFLLDPKRSLEFFIGKGSGVHDSVALRCLDTIIETYAFSKQNLSFGGILESQSVQYAFTHWSYHCVHAAGSVELISKLEKFDVYAATTLLLRGRMSLKPGHSYWSGIALLAEPLHDILEKISKVWARFKAEYGQSLQHFSDISTTGFCVSLHNEEAKYRVAFGPGIDATLEIYLLLLQVESFLQSHKRPSSYPFFLRLHPL